MSDTIERLSALLIRDLGLAAHRLSPDAELEALGVDSLGTVELLWSIEETFLIKVPARPPELRTLGDVARYVDELVALQGAPAAGAAAAAATAGSRVPAA
jgi:acyl carrier protein